MCALYNHRKTASVSLITATSNRSWHFQCIRGLKFKRKYTFYDKGWLNTKIDSGPDFFERTLSYTF